MRPSDPSAATAPALRAERVTYSFTVEAGKLEALDEAARKKAAELYGERTFRITSMDVRRERWGNTLQYVYKATVDTDLSW